MSNARWNLFSAFMAGLTLGVFATGFALHSYLTSSEIKPRQETIYELQNENIRLTGELSRCQRDSLSGGH